MSKSGITRRIDELGRIVIPKEMRRVLGIRDGESLEINIEDEKIVIGKYNHMKSLSELSSELIKIYSSIYNNKIIITDREKIVNCDFEKNLVNASIDSTLINLIDNRESLVTTEFLSLKFSDVEMNINAVINPIINDTDCVGLVIILCEEICNIENVNVAKLISRILAEKISIS